MFTWILIFAISLGQLIKFPLSSQGGLTILDITILIINIWALFKSKFRLQSPPLWIKSAFLFTFVALISLILTPLHLTFTEYLTSCFYIIRFLAFILFGWIIYSNVLPALNKNIAQVLIFSGIILAILGLLQFIFLPNLEFLAINGWDPHYFRTVSTLLDPNFFGSFATLTLILLTIEGIKHFQPKLLILLFSLTYISFITTYSRSSALMFFISFVTLSFLKKSIKLLVLTIILTLGFALNFLTYQSKIAEPNKIDRVASAQARLDTWQQGWQLFSTHPILGIGFNSYKFGLREYNLGSEQFLQNRGATTNDSSLLYVSATTGVVGLAVYLSFIFLLIRQSFRNFKEGNTWGLGLMAGLIGLVFHSFFANSLFYPWILIWIILAACKQKSL